MGKDLAIPMYIMWRVQATRRYFQRVFFQKYLELQRRTVISNRRKLIRLCLKIRRNIMSSCVHLAILFTVKCIKICNFDNNKSGRSQKIDRLKHKNLSLFHPLSHSFLLCLILFRGIFLFSYLFLFILEFLSDGSFLWMQELLKFRLESSLLKECAVFGQILIQVFRSGFQLLYL